MSRSLDSFSHNLYLIYVPGRQPYDTLHEVDPRTHLISTNVISIGL